uniref:Uncharacterized protein n=1 Tax=Amphimedon queenslandica TaxID=400682 RepID=A0A1X7TDQ7_AMPQE
MSHWFRHIAEGEPCDTYLKLSSGNLARTSEIIETQQSTFNGDDALCVQNLQSIAGYTCIFTQQWQALSLPLTLLHLVDLLTRVEEAVERFLYWDEGVMIYEAVTSSPSSHDVPVTGGVADEVFDSGVSSISGSSTGGGGNTSSCHSRDESTPDTTNAHGGNCWSPSRRNIGLDDSISEKWAQASSNCSDAKEYLEMICRSRDLPDELAQFDLRKEQELRQVFFDLAA